VDVNSAGRLRAVENFDNAASGQRGENTRQRPGAAEALSSLRREVAKLGSGASVADLGSGDPRLQLEKLCVRAERQGGYDSWVQALPHLHDRLREAPSDAQAWVYLAQANCAKGKAGHDDALRAADEALRLDSRIPLGYSLDALIARRCLKAREWETSVRHAEAGLVARPNDEECLEVLARALVAQDKRDRADTALASLANTVPDRAAKLAYSFASETGLEPRKRHHWLSRAIAWGRGRDRPLREMGEVCLVMRDDVEAVQWFQKAFAQNPEDIEAMNALAQLHVRTGRVEEALEVYRSASRALPENYIVHRKLSMLLLQERQATEAVEVIRKAARLAPPADSSGLYVALADLQQSMGLHPEALRAWEAAVALDENSTAGWRGLVAAASTVGNERAQMRALSQLCRLEPSSRDWPTRLEQLRAASSSEPVRAPEPASDPAPSLAPKSSTPAAPPADWRDHLFEAQECEVYSKSAGKWIPSRVVQLSTDMVKLKYLIDGHWCEKVLLRNSEMLRPVLAAAPVASSTPEPAPMPSPQARQPEPKAREAEGYPSPPRQAAQPAPVPAARAQDPYKSAPPPAAPAVSSERPPAQEAASRDRSDTYTSAAPAVKPAPYPTPTPVANKKSVEEDPPRRQYTEPKAEPVVQKPPPRASPSRSHPELLEPSELQFGQVLGSGGFGAVYRGTYKGEEVAIKKLHPMDTGSISGAQMEEFKKEVANLQALRHPRLVSFIGAAYVTPSLCLVLEYMANGSLYDLLHQRKMMLKKSERYMMVMHITEGVNFLHGRSPPFVHRDLKSLNVVLDMNLGCKLCDFGLTQTMDNTHISRKDNEGGSPRYMAPELFDSKGRITEKVDVWALGCLAIEVFTGRVPHEECNTIQQVMIKTLVDKKLPFVDMTTVNPDVKILAEQCFVFDTYKRIDAGRFYDGLCALKGRL